VIYTKSCPRNYVLIPVSPYIILTLRENNRETVVLFEFSFECVKYVVVIVTTVTIRLSVFGLFFFLLLSDLSSTVVPSFSSSRSVRHRTCNFRDFCLSEFCRFVYLYYKIPGLNSFRMQVFPCALSKHHVLKAYGKIQCHAFLTSALDGGEWSASCPWRFTLK
jgi:hypothetical protein